MPRKILLADDSVTAQNMGKKILADAGYLVTAVSNGAAALKKILEQKPDLVVLDVYMPGYSGIEVCRRLKESSDTATIPVLLTVGKLEPFKPEEATKARADAFIIKPFEASELVALVKKLEDAVLARPEPKPSKIAQVLSSFNDLDADTLKSSEKKADNDQGWKSRLSIPKRSKDKSKEREVEPEPEETFPSASNRFRDLQTTEHDEHAFRRESAFTADPAATVATSSAASDVSLDISPQEIAAIKAAAALLSGEGDSAPVLNVGTAPAEPDTIQDSEVKTEASAEPEKAIVEIPSLPPAVEAPSTALAAPEAVAEAQAAPATVPGAEDKAAAIVAATKAAEPVAERPAAEVATPAPPAEPEVKAPETPNVAAETQPETSVHPDALKVDAAPVEASAVAAPAVEPPPPAVSRWIAEAVALSAAETELSLDRELAEKRAPAPAAPPPIVFSDFHEVYQPGPVEDEPILAESNPPTVEPEAAVAVAAAVNADPEAVSAVAVVASASEVPAPPAFAAAAGAETAAPHVVAAAPVVSEGTSSAPPPDAAPSVAMGDHDPDTSAQARANMAAAWANWHDIRDTVMGSNLKNQIVEAASTVVASREPAPASSGKEESAAAPAAADSNAIASIVDSVLAELKPKLVEEIAKKLRKE